MNNVCSARSACFCMSGFRWRNDGHKFVRTFCVVGNTLQIPLGWKGKSGNNIKLTFAEGRFYCHLTRRCIICEMSKAEHDMIANIE